MLHKNPDTCLLCCWVIPNPAGFIGSCKEAIGLTAITECHKAHILYLQITGAVTSDKNIYIQEPVSTRCLYLCFGGWGWSLPALGSLLNGVIAAPTPLHLGGQIPEKQSGENRRLFVTLGTSSSTALAVASVGEASALAAAGWQRSLLCPRGKGIQESWICGRAHRLHTWLNTWRPLPTAHNELRSVLRRSWANPFASPVETHLDIELLPPHQATALQGKSCLGLMLSFLSVLEKEPALLSSSYRILTSD